ncbi:hypothetical protein GCM10011487_47640 [Steroidobacter agaridevorans]|uniref:Uncharacterized protein n=1 Tax=Steroidobacter agaridevorans TaxID=2695856 RepID=A0A829YHM0_9GAMM|nr:hypothetical protein [Steroidobacter agaridevorans]GFE82764.1 hypothetical protein GCM10011487_47640 [Steroidobacter agaridevorans]GFE85851.1 hypothetical protein GCM10011488_08050 [Steroidobacter agaridevorans]
MDRWTQLVGKVADLLLMNSPNRTGLGVVLGLGVYVLTLIFEPMLNNFTLLNLTRLPAWGLPVLGIVVMNLRAIKCSLTEDSVGDEEVDVAIKVIEKAKMSPGAARHQYILLIAKVIEGIKVKRESPPDLRTD